METARFFFFTVILWLLFGEYNLKFSFGVEAILIIAVKW